MDKAVELWDEAGTISYGAISGFSVTWPSATSIYGDDTSLSMGSVSFSIPTISGFKSRVGDVLRLINLSKWAPTPEVVIDTIEIYFRVTGVSSSRGVTSVTGTFDNSPLVPGGVGLNLDYQFAYAEISTLGAYPVVLFYDTAGTVVTTVVAGMSLTSVYPAGTKFGLTPGNGLATVAGFAQAIGWIFVPDDRIGQLRPPATTVSPLRDYVDAPMSLSESQPASAVEVVRYVGGYQDDVEILAVFDEGSIIQVDASETIEVDIPIEGWVLSVNQPVASNFVQADAHYYDGTDGVYSIAGNDNRPITAAQWTAQGGKVVVSKHPEDPKTVRVTVTGASGTDYAPYRLAMTSGNYYNSLRITADTIVGIPETITFPTGADEAIVLADSVITIDNPSVQSLEQAYDIGTRAARQYTGLLSGMSIDSGSRVHLGALYEREYRRYLVRSMSGDPTAVVNADTEVWDTMEFFEEVWPNADYTMADFQAQWPNATMTMKDFMIEYLRNEQ